MGTFLHQKVSHKNIRHRIIGGNNKEERRKIYKAM